MLGYHPDWKGDAAYQVYVDIIQLPELSQDLPMVNTSSEEVIVMPGEFRCRLPRISRRGFEEKDVMCTSTFPNNPSLLEHVRERHEKIPVPKLSGWTLRRNIETRAYYQDLEQMWHKNRETRLQGDDSSGQPKTNHNSRKIEQPGPVTLDILASIMPRFAALLTLRARCQDEPVDLYGAFGHPSQVQYFTQPEFFDPLLQIDQVQQFNIPQSNPLQQFNQVQGFDNMQHPNPLLLSDPLLLPYPLLQSDPLQSDPLQQSNPLLHFTPLQPFDQTQQFNPSQHLTQAQPFNQQPQIDYQSLYMLPQSGTLEDYSQNIPYSEYNPHDPQPGPSTLRQWTTSFSNQHKRTKNYK